MAAIRPLRTLLITAAVVLAATVGASAPAAEEARQPSWSGAWAQAVQQADGTDREVSPWALTGFADQSVRQVLRLSQGGDAVRVRLSNLYGTVPLRIAGATVALAGANGAVDGDSLRALTFAWSLTTAIAPGEEYTSDPALLPVEAFDRIAVTLYFADATGPATYHRTALEMTYRASGDHRFDAGAGAYAQTSTSSYFLTRVEVAGPAMSTKDTVVAFGDSITDGLYAGLGGDDRYPDRLAERVAAAGLPYGVLNAGISGNRLLADTPDAGESGLSRFARDVLAQPNVRAVILLEGINDIGWGRWTGAYPTAESIVAGYRAVIAAARAHGVRVIGATILPVKGSSYYTAEGELVRDQVNAWIRTSGEYDAVVDFEAAVADPADPDRMLAAYNSGDSLHPNPAGFAAMAQAVDLAVL